MTERVSDEVLMEKGLPGNRHSGGDVSLEVEVLVSSPKGTAPPHPFGEVVPPAAMGGPPSSRRKSGPSSAPSAASLGEASGNGEAAGGRKSSAGRAGSAAGSDRKGPAGGGQGAKAKGKARKKKRKRSAVEEEEDKCAPTGVFSREGGERRKMVLLISVFAAGIFITAVLLIAITLRLSPAIDEKIRKENEQMMNSLNREGNTIVATEDNTVGGSTEVGVGASDSGASAAVTANASVMGTEERVSTSPSSSSSTKGTP